MEAARQTDRLLSACPDRAAPDAQKGPRKCEFLAASVYCPAAAMAAALPRELVDRKSAIN